MSELSEVPVQNSSPACYTIEDDDEPEVVFISDNMMSEEDIRDGEPSSTTSDVNGDEEQEIDTVNASVDLVENGTQQETSELSDASDQDESSGNVLNDCIKLIDLVKSYEKVDKTVKTKFKDGFIFLENLQTQFEDTERNISEKDEMIAKLIAENSKLKEDSKQLKGEMSTQSLQFGMLKNKYVKLEEELKGLKTNEKRVEEPVIPMPKNLSLEMMKSKADKMQKFFRQLCSKMSEEGVNKSDPESVKRSKELKSFQNEVGVLFIKVQHKLSKWVKNQVKMEEELESCRMLLELLHNMVISESQIENVSNFPTVAVVESTASQPEKKKRKLPPPQLVPLQVSTIQQQTTITTVPVPNELPKTVPHSPVSDSVASSYEYQATQLIDMKSKSSSSCVTSLQVPTLSAPPPVVMQTSSPTAKQKQPSPSTLASIQPSLPTKVPLQPSPPVMTIQSSASSPLVSTLPPLLLSDSRSSPPSQQQSFSCLYQLPPLPHLNFPLPPLKPIFTTPAPSSSDKVVTSPVSSLSPPPPQAQPAQVKPPVKRRRAKPLRTTPTHSPLMTSDESRYSFTPPQYSQAPYPVHPTYNPYSVSPVTPNEPHQATHPAFNNQMTQIPLSTAKFLPQQQHQITSSSPPVSTQNIMSPSASILETKTATNVTHQNKCLVCAMTFATPIQLKLHHAVVHSNKTPSSALSGPAATSPPTSSPSTTHQQSLSRPLLAPPPPLQERHQNAASSQRVPSIRQTVISANTSIGATTTTCSTNEPNQKRHCSGLSPLTSVLPSNSIPRSAMEVSPISINKNSMNNSVNFTQPYDNNLFSFLDLL